MCYYNPMSSAYAQDSALYSENIIRNAFHMKIDVKSITKLINLAIFHLIYFRPHKPGFLIDNLFIQLALLN
jgi:hypothetical protein